MTKELHDKISSVLLDKIGYLNDLIEDLRLSNNDTKSSMGDKYETSREMIQQEITRIQNQLKEVLIQQEQFYNIGVNESQVVINGSYVETSMGNYIIACSLGEIMFDSKKIYVLSNQTPLAKVLIGKSKGDTFEINGKIFSINKVD